ncbi:hypothetical protein ACF073_30275 [Streptomyces sp. NPDC015171]|uniref:hypothetical protein n=1 Tax=Streptomyces sp. NPDC015171 TaxID=3364945 RepID=UPI0036FEC7C1
MGQPHPVGRRQGPRPGAGFLALGLAVPVLLCAAACGGSARSPASAPAPPAPHRTPASTATATTPASEADLCTLLVVHWAREALDGGTYGDYQSMGLSHGQYQILRDAVDAGRVVRRRQGAVAADGLMKRRIRGACVDRYRHGTPSEGPWT